MLRRMSPCCFLMPFLRSTPCLEPVGWARSREPRMACNLLLRHLSGIIFYTSYPRFHLNGHSFPLLIRSSKYVQRCRRGNVKLPPNGLHVTIVPDVIVTLEHFDIRVDCKDSTIQMVWAVVRGSRK
ncbi:hypothetical protein EDD16DRAFT_1546262 [Pisolithus croceorrhizus]|nr:hypothetical protein EDD16DRAFT_1546262 [Pisolithus croceorrhizus]KAI6162372.1 hypothetical protein EDD17DRAFT_1577257 [Pisolithus thermaeus]